MCRVSQDANAVSEGATEYSRLLPSSKERRLSVRPYKKYSSTSWNLQDDSGESSSDDGLASSDEVSSSSSSNVTSRMNTRQLVIFAMIMVSTLSSSFAV